MRGHQVVADLFLFFQEVRLEKHYMGASTYSMEIKITWIIFLNLGLTVLEKHMRSCYYPPYQDICIRTTWKKETTHFDLYMEIVCYGKLNRVDERDLSHMV